MFALLKWFYFVLIKANNIIILNNTIRRIASQQMSCKICPWFRFLFIYQLLIWFSKCIYAIMHLIIMTNDNDMTVIIDDCIISVFIAIKFTMTNFIIGVPRGTILSNEHSISQCYIIYQFMIVITKAFANFEWSRMTDDAPIIDTFTIWGYRMFVMTVLCCRVVF